MLTVYMNFSEKLNEEFSKLSPGKQKEFIIKNFDSLEVSGASRDAFYIMDRETVEKAIEERYYGTEQYAFFQEDGMLDELMDYLSYNFEMINDESLWYYINCFYDENK